MSQQLTDFFANAAMPSLVDDATTGLGAVRPPHISRRGNRFTLVDAAGNTKPHDQLHLNMVIVGVNKNRSKMFFDGPYKEDNSDPPACWSDNGIGPSTQAAKPQSQTCALCPHDAWGSAISKLTGAGIRACADSKKIAVILPGDSTEMIYEFTVPPGSFGNWTQFVRTISGFMVGQRKAQLFDVVTKVAFEPKSMGVLTFEPAALVDQGLAGRVIAAIQSGSIPQIVGLTDVAREGPVAPRPIAQDAPRQIAAPQGLEAAPAEPKKPVGRPRKAQVEPPFEGDPNMPPFLRREQPAAPVQIADSQLTIMAPQQTPTAPAAPAASPSSPPVQFGIAQAPAAPDNQLQAALSKAFNLPT